MSRKRAAVRPERAPDRQDQHDVDEVADHRVQPGAERRLVKPQRAPARPRSRRGRRSPAAPRSRSRRWATCRSRPSARRRRRRSRPASVSSAGVIGRFANSSARQRDEILRLIRRSTMPDRVALQVARTRCRAAARREARVDDLDALVEAAGLQPDGVGADAGRLGAELLLQRRERRPSTSPSISRRSMFGGRRRGNGMLPSLTTMTRASRRRASWRMARSTTRMPPTRMRAPVASASVARRITGITVCDGRAHRARREHGGGAGNRAELTGTINHHAMNPSLPVSVRRPRGAENAIPPGHTQGKKDARDRVSALTETWRVSVLTVSSGRARERAERECRSGSTQNPVVPIDWNALAYARSADGDLAGVPHRVRGGGRGAAGADGAGRRAAPAHARSGVPAAARSSWPRGPASCSRSARSRGRCCRSSWACCGRASWAASANRSGCRSRSRASPSSPRRSSSASTSTGAAGCRRACTSSSGVAVAVSGAASAFFVTLVNAFMNGRRAAADPDRRDVQPVVAVPGRARAALLLPGDRVGDGRDPRVRPAARSGADAAPQGAGAGAADRVPHRAGAAAVGRSLGQARRGARSR